MEDLEAKRQHSIASKQARLTAADAYRIAVEEKYSSQIDKKVTKTGEIQERLSRQQELEGMSEMAGVDEASRYKMDADFAKLARFLDIDASDFENNLDQLKFIMEWGSEASKSSDILKILGSIKNLKNSYGFREVGTTGLKKLYMYARLDADERRIKEEKKLLKNG